MKRHHNAKLGAGGARRLARLVLSGLVIMLVLTDRTQATIKDSDVGVVVAFGENCEALLLKHIGRAREEMLVAIYTITRKSITEALVEARKRGVDVNVKYDAKASEWRGMRQAIGFMKRRGIRCTAITYGDEYGKMHHKFVVIDRERVLTGSYNFTTAASISNHENLLCLESEAVAQAFAREFEAVKSE